MSLVTVTIVASSLALFAESRYIYTIVQGKTRPNFAGWFIFVLSMSMVLASAYSLGARESLFLVGTFLVLHSIVVVLSLKYGFVRFTSLEILFVAISLFGLILWLYTSNPWYAFLINFSIDVFGYTTVAIKAYIHKGTEDATAWLLSLVAYGLNLLVITWWVPQEYLFTVSNIFFCLIITLIALRK